MPSILPGTFARRHTIQGKRTSGRSKAKEADVSHPLAKGEIEIAEGAERRRGGPEVEGDSGAGAGRSLRLAQGWLLGSCVGLAKGQRTR